VDRETLKQRERGGRELELELEYFNEGNWISQRLLYTRPSWAKIEDKHE